MVKNMRGLITQSIGQFWLALDANLIAIRHTYSGMRILLGLIILTCSAVAHAQSAEKSAVYVSEIDSQLTLRKFTVLPVTDNLDGIYARPLESQLIELIHKDHHWEFVEAKVAGAVMTPTELEGNPGEVRKVGNALGVDAVFAAKATKGPEGIGIVLDLFLTYDGLLFAQEQAVKMTQFEIKDLQTKMTELYSKVVAKIPYQGLVLSRSGTRVTVNLGKKDGVTKDQLVSAVQVIKLNRHPKFGFIINTEKEILGKIKLQKVEDSLSFGAIVTEKEKGAIRKFTKISGVDFVSYNDAPGFKGYEDQREALDKPGAKVAFGANPEEWKPIRPATFGEVNLSLGLGSYTTNTSLNTGTATISPAINNPAVFSLRLASELWITPNWILEAELRQSVFSAPNPRSSSTPSPLNFAISRYGLLAGYNFLIRNGDFFGPKISILLGFTQFTAYVDDSSPPSFVSSSYRGLTTGFKGSFPIDPQEIWKLGAKFYIVFSPSLSESPYRLGDSSNNTMTWYSLFGSKRVGQRIEITGQLDFELYSSSYSGGGSLPTGERGISSSHRVTTLAGGISYLF
ncbi:MAG: hypothetical protein ABL958_10885 [Bdellovibrionia bacterium]